MRGGRKNLLIFFVLLISSLPICAETLEGSISVDSARSEAFEGIEKALSKDELTIYKSDRFHYSNLDLIKEGKYSVNYGYERKIEPVFSKRGKLLRYSVQYQNHSNKKLYYSKRDRLLKYEISNFKGTYPYKTVSYSSRGKLSNINYIASEDETFVFNKKGKLIAYEINGEYYSAKGKRKLIKHF